MKTVWLMLLRAGPQANGDVIVQESLRSIAASFQPGMLLTAKMAGVPTGVGSVQAVEVRGEELWAKVAVRPMLVREQHESVDAARLREVMFGSRQAAE